MRNESHRRSAGYSSGDGQRNGAASEPATPTYTDYQALDSDNA
jgi:hypothetical protein